MSVLLCSPEVEDSSELVEDPSPPGAAGRAWSVRLRWLAIGLVGVLIAGNAAIAGVSVWARRTTSVQPGPAMVGVRNFRVVDARLWRGAAPSPRGYEALAAAGVRTVIDLRAESDLEIDDAYLRQVGLERVALPMRDGQTPSAEKIQTLMDVVASSPGPVFVHCGAGVGRTGTMAAAYLVATGQTDEWSAMRRNLAVGPPSLEQLAFVAGLDDSDRPGPLLVTVSRLLDAPRRLWSRLRA